MNIDSIKNGIVIDHITAGKGEWQEEKEPTSEPSEL